MMNVNKHVAFDMAAFATLATLIGGACLIVGRVPSNYNPLVRISADEELLLNSTDFHVLQAELDSEDYGPPPVHHAIDPAEFYQQDEGESDFRHEDDERVKDPLAVGEFAELYDGPLARLATPAFIEGLAGSTYTVRVGLKRKEVDANFVHRYERYPRGTYALCSVANVRSSDMTTPCLVKSSLVNRVHNGFVTYEVSYLNDAGESISVFMPFPKVTRIINPPSSLTRSVSMKRVLEQNKIATSST